MHYLYMSEDQNHPMTQIVLGGDSQPGRPGSHSCRSEDGTYLRLMGYLINGSPSEERSGILPVCSGRSAPYCCAVITKHPVGMLVDAGDGGNW